MTPTPSSSTAFEKPTRYTGREHGVHRKDWNDVQARICLAFPDIYDIGMSHLGYRILYRLLNENPRTLAERCYAPWVDLARELRERNLPLVSLESYRPLHEFDVVGFSLQFELCHTNVLAMLELGRIPLRAANRDENAPLVIAGGPVATHPEPVAPFFDAILIGDGEKAAADIALSWVEGKKRGDSREQRLKALAKLPGVYVPSLYDTARDERTGLEVVTSAKTPEAPLPIQRHIVENLAEYPFPTTGPVGGPEAIFDRMSVEVARGCTEGCRFCQAGMIYRPVRERPPEQVIDAVMTAVKNSGQDEVSLTALSTADVSYISPLIKSLTKKTAPERISLGVASLRAYGLDEDLLDELRKVRATGLTFAPEAGTQRMRDVINKNVTEAQLLETAERVFSRGWDRMKLYFILGLPTETDEDLEGIIHCGRRAMDVGRRVAKKRLTITVSVSVHVPKPHTPFQWCAMDSLSEIRRKQALLRQLVRGNRGLELKVHESVASVLECILARGDRRIADVIERAYENGARFDSWDDQFLPEVWDEALNHFGIDRALYLGTLPVDARLPWSHIDVGLDPEFLPREYKKALKSRLSPPCGKPVGMHAHHTNLADERDDQRKLVCYDCGIECDLTEMRERRAEYLVSLGALTRPERKAPQTAQLPSTAGESDEAPSNETFVTTTEPTQGLAETSHEVASQTLAMPVLTSDASSEASTSEARTDDGVGLVAQNESAALQMAPDADVGLSDTNKATADAPERFRPEQPRQNAERWRLRFAKTGTASMLGHLDLIRELPRSFRRANLRVAYTRGFHPKPDLSFAPALSLGVPSLDEFVDATLLDPPQRDELLARLKEATSGGLIFEDAARLPDRAPTLSKTIGAGRYALVVPRSLVDEIGGPTELEARIASFLAEASVFLTRQVDRATKRVDVRKHVISIGFGDDLLVDYCRKAGLLGEFLTLDVLIAIRPEGSSKATEVGLALLGDAGHACRAVRVALLDHEHLPLAQRFPR
ncbi:MAG: TIGR03960 family B12-binding radical SAM protein [Polyangiaceae bacterium]